MMKRLKNMDLSNPFDAMIIFGLIIGMSLITLGGILGLTFLAIRFL